MENQFMRCHCEPGSFNTLNRGIYNSCNTYFAHVYRKTIDQFENPKIGMNIWSNHIKSFGLGNYLGYDHPIGQKGFIPNADYYDYWYPNQMWRGSTSISNAIGQGEILATPIQLANVAAAIANRGHYFTPHFIKSIDNDVDLSKLIQMTFIEKLLIIIAVWSIVIFLFRKLK